MSQSSSRTSPAVLGAFDRLAEAAPGAVESALVARLAVYDRAAALTRFCRLSPQIVAAETPEAARLVVRALENALRKERARTGHWSYDLNRHIAVLTAYRAESARLEKLRFTARGL